jgi:pimeloyl-ACP methyl ester carboxylesterase
LRRPLAGWERALDGFILTDDRAKLWFTDDGAGDPVVFVHGWQTSLDLWRPVVATLADTARLVTYDQRGHGRSDTTPSGWTVHRLARDLDLLLDRLDLSAATLVGHGMGCAIIWAYLELFGPDRVARLTLVEPCPNLIIDPVWDQDTIDQAGSVFTDAEIRVLAHALADPESRDEIVGYIATRMTTPGCPAEVVEQLVTWGTRVDANASAALFTDMAHHDWRELIAQIRLPTVVVAGEASHIPTTAAKWIAATIPDASLAIVAACNGGSHALALENPVALAHLLRTHLPVNRQPARRQHLGRHVPSHPHPPGARR